ncbi:MAG: thioesterase family protein [Oxalobacteraceae bacterium]|nr:thioesterase family protein [Oxalobacteraceae bacterium]
MRVSIYRLTVEFGDCDPANIVFYPNYYRWFDAATHHLCKGVGLDWISMRDQYGVVGMPLVETGASYQRPASFGDHLEIESNVVECGRKSLRLRHLVRRGETLLVEGFEVRVLGARHPDDPQRLRALEIPAAIRNALTEGESWK